jgi:hypothetical protein
MENTIIQLPEMTDFDLFLQTRQKSFLKKNFVGILVETTTPKRHLEIN